MASSVCIQPYRGCIPLSWLAFPMVKAQGDQWRQGQHLYRLEPHEKPLCLIWKQNWHLKGHTAEKGKPTSTPTIKAMETSTDLLRNQHNCFSLALVWLVVGLINFLQQRDPMISPNMTFIGLACGMILAESHSLLGLINPGDQISDAWGAAVATDHLWDGTIRAHCGGMSQTHTEASQTCTKAKDALLSADGRHTHISSFGFLLLYPCYYLHVGLMRWRPYW